jgi:glycosyltransferase involved in cell wall biosynthesis
MGTRYKVSVRLMTYNHEKYIAQAIESILNQRTNFPIELIIGDDNSTDGTFEIIQQYQSNNNIDLKILDRRSNYIYKKNRAYYGRNYNNTDILQNCSGQYIAMLEGDDYWTDPLKLQKQVDFLEINPGFSFCYHHVKVIQESDFVNQKLEMKFNQPEISTLQEILKKSIWPHTNAVVFRNHQFLRNFPLWFYKCLSADWALLAIVAGDNKIKYIPNSMSVYRQHGTGIWSKNTQLKNNLNTIKTARVLNKFFVKKKDKIYIYWPLHYSYKEIILYYNKKSFLRKFYYVIMSNALDIKYRLSLRRVSLSR